MQVSQQTLSHLNGNADMQKTECVSPLTLSDAKMVTFLPNPGANRCAL